MEIKKDWLLATLTDANDALSEAIEELENGDNESAELVMNNLLLHVYAKLNYAVNTAYLGDEALEVMSEDELIAWPESMPFSLEAAEDAEEDSDEDDEERDDN